MLYKEAEEKADEKRRKRGISRESNMCSGLRWDVYMLSAIDHSWHAPNGIDEIDLVEMK